MIIRRTNCQKNKEITYDTVVVGGGEALLVYQLQHQLLKMEVRHY